MPKKHPSPWTFDTVHNQRGTIEARIFDKDGHLVMVVWDDWPDETEALAKRICRAVNAMEKTKTKLLGS